MGCQLLMVRVMQCIASLRTELTDGYIGGNGVTSLMGCEMDRLNVKEDLHDE